MGEQGGGGTGGGGGVIFEQDMASAQDTIYLCNFRVSVDGEWLCLKELQDVELSFQDPMQRSPSPPLALSGIQPHHHHDHHRHRHLHIHRKQLLEHTEFCDLIAPNMPSLQQIPNLCL